MLTMYAVDGRRPDIITLVVFPAYDFCQVSSTAETCIWNVTCSPFQNFFEIGFHESLIPVVLVSESFSKMTGPDGTE